MSQPAEKDAPCPECGESRWATDSDAAGGVVSVAAVCVSCGYVTTSTVDVGHVDPTRELWRCGCWRSECAGCGPRRRGETSVTPPEVSA